MFGKTSSFARCNQGTCLMGDIHQQWIFLLVSCLSWIICMAKAAKLAGAKESGHIRLVPIVDPVYVEFVEKNVVNKAHSSSYLKRMKDRCASALTKEEILVLTDDSDDNGGQDTRKCFTSLVGFTWFDTSHTEKSQEALKELGMQLFVVWLLQFLQRTRLLEANV